MFRFVALYLMVASSYCACIKFPDSDQFDAFINQIESELDGDNDNEDEKRNCVLNDLDAARTALEVVKKARERGDLDKGKFKAVIDDFYKKLAALEKSYKAIRRNRVTDLGRVPSSSIPGELIVKLICASKGHMIGKQEDMPIFFYNGTYQPLNVNGQLSCSYLQAGSKENGFERPPLP